MYEQAGNPKENKSLAVANSVAQKKSNMKQDFGFADNRPEAVMQGKLKKLMHDRHLKNNFPRLKNQSA